MLTSPSGSRRDGALFAAAALTPSIAMGALALRAISNEDAGARREVALALTAAARQAASVPPGPRSVVLGEHRRHKPPPRVSMI